MNEPARQIAAHDPVQTLATRYGQTYGRALNEIAQLTHTHSGSSKLGTDLKSHGMLIDVDLGIVGNAAAAASKDADKPRARTFELPRAER